MKNLSCHLFGEFSSSERYYFFGWFVVSVFFMTLTLLFNVLLLLTFCFKLTYRDLRLKLIMLLSCVDLVQGLTTYPISTAILYKRSQGLTECFMIAENEVLAHCLVFATIVIICVIAAEQYFYIVHPFLHDRYISGKSLCIPSLVISAAIFTVNIMKPFVNLFWRTIFEGISIGACALIFLLTIFFYLSMWWTWRRVQKQITDQNKEEGLRISQQAKASKTSFLVLLAFVICYMPRISLMGYDIVVGVTRWIGIYVEWPTALMAFAKSWLNPVIYFWRLAVVRSTIKKTLDGILSKLHVVSGEKPPNHEQLQRRVTIQSVV